MTTLADLIASTPEGDAIAFLPVAREIIERNDLRAEYVWEERTVKLPAVPGEKDRKTKTIEVRRVKVVANRELRDLVAEICMTLNPHRHTDRESHYEPTNLLRAYALHWNRAENEIVCNPDPARELAYDLADVHRMTNSRAAVAA